MSDRYFGLIKPAKEISFKVSLLILLPLIGQLIAYHVLLFNVIEKLSNNSFDYRKHLNDIRQEISIIGRKNHDAEQTIKRYLVHIEIDAGVNVGTLGRQNKINFD